MCNTARGTGAIRNERCSTNEQTVINHTYTPTHATDHFIVVHTARALSRGAQDAGSDIPASKGAGSDVALRRGRLWSGHAPSTGARPAGALMHGARRWPPELSRAACGHPPGLAAACCGAAQACGAQLYTKV